MRKLFSILFISLCFISCGRTKDDFPSVSAKRLNGKPILDFYKTFGYTNNKRTIDSNTYIIRIEFGKMDKIYYDFFFVKDTLRDFNEVKFNVKND